MPFMLHSYGFVMVNYLVVSVRFDGYSEIS